MRATAKQKDDHVKVKQYLIDARGLKVAAVLDLKELARVNGLIEDLLDLKAIEDRVSEPSEDYEAYSRRRKTRLHV